MHQLVKSRVIDGQIVYTLREVSSVRGVFLVEVCSSNRACVPRIFELETEFPHISVVEIDCMSECEQCILTPYVFLNGEMVTDTDVESLLIQLERLIEGSV